MTEKESVKVSLIDTHCHLDMSQFDNDRSEVIARAKDAGFEALITIGSDLDGTRKAMELAGLHDFVYASIGIHPHDAKDFSEDTYRDLALWAGNGKVIAIGETGLDYYYNHSPRDIQKEVFRKHLRLAQETGLPVIVHSRDAKEDTLAILADSGVTTGVLHCFSGDKTMAEQAIAMGLAISFAGPVTFRKSSHLRDLARFVPDDSLLIETDAPYLAPVPYRGKRNEPLYLRETARLIAELREISLEDLARITTLNAKRLFGIGLLPEKAEIAYQIRDSLYLNITNRCTNACSFCVKFRSDFVKGHKLRLTREPTDDELKREIGDPARYKEVVFCGYGEPLQRLETVKEISKWVKDHGGNVRVNTNGQANLIHKRDILSELKGIVDRISISLDAQDEVTYNRVCRPAYANAYEEVIRFIRQAKQYIPEVQVTVVALDGVDVEKCRVKAAELGVPLRIRKLDVVG